MMALAGCGDGISFGDPGAAAILMNVKPGVDLRSFTEDYVPIDSEADSDNVVGG